MSPSVVPSVKRQCHSGSHLWVSLAAECWGPAWSWGKVPLLFWYHRQSLPPKNRIGQSGKNLWPMEYFKAFSQTKTPNAFRPVGFWIGEVVLIVLLATKWQSREILVIHSTSFHSYVYFSHFPWDFRDSLDRGFNLCSIRWRIFFVSLVLNLVLIRQERSQPSRRDTLTLKPRLLPS